MCLLPIWLSFAVKTEHRWDGSAVRAAFPPPPPPTPNTPSLLLSRGAVVQRSPLLWSLSSSGELYSRDSRNSCITKVWCHCLTAPPPPRFQRPGWTGLRSAPALTTAKPPRLRLLFAPSFKVAAWANGKRQQRTFEREGGKTMSGTHGKQEHPQGNDFMGQLHKILKVKPGDADSAGLN